MSHIVSSTMEFHYQSRCLYKPDFLVSEFHQVKEQRAEQKNTSEKLFFAQLNIWRSPSILTT